MLERIKETAAFIQARIENFQPEVGIILGTGLGDFADRIDEKYSIDYKEIPNFPVSTVEGHKGKLIFGLLEGGPISGLGIRLMWSVMTIRSPTRNEGFTPPLAFDTNR